MDLIKQVHKLAEKHGIEVIDRPNGHMQLKGALLVNYYPNSTKRTAYVAGTKKKELHVTPERAIQMTMTAPTIKKATKRRYSSKQARRWKLSLLKKHPFCKWCNCPLTIETATLEHIIPRARGGLDNMNNFALACEPHNSERGHDMPELEKGIKNAI